MAEVLHRCIEEAVAEVFAVEKAADVKTYR